MISKEEYNAIIDRYAEKLRNKAINDFAENCTLRISESLIWGMLPANCKDGVAEEITEYVLDVVREIAEQLRGGVE